MAAVAMWGQSLEGSGRVGTEPGWLQWPCGDRAWTAAVTMWGQSPDGGSGHFGTEPGWWWPCGDSLDGGGGRVGTAWTVAVAVWGQSGWWWLCGAEPGRRWWPCGDRAWRATVAAWGQPRQRWPHEAGGGATRPLCLSSTSPASELRAFPVRRVQLGAEKGLAFTASDLTLAQAASPMLQALGVQGARLCERASRGPAWLLAGGQPVPAGPRPRGTEAGSPHPAPPHSPPSAPACRVTLRESVPRPLWAWFPCRYGTCWKYTQPPSLPRSGPTPAETSRTPQGGASWPPELSSAPSPSFSLPFF